MTTMTIKALVSAQKVCPISPGPAADHAAHHITGNVLWGIIALFAIAILVGIGAIVGGRTLGMPHASKAGVITLVVVFIAGIAMLTVPGMFHGVIHSGCVNL